MPFTNAALLAGCLLLVLAFRESSRLAAAYGIAVALTMVITTVLFYLVARRRWGWPAWKAALLTGSFLAAELAFCGSNLLKVAHGGWVPLTVAAAVFAAMTTWRSGRRLLGEKLAQRGLPMDLLLQDELLTRTATVPGTAVFMSGRPDAAPLSLLHNLKHNRVLHERNLLLHIIPLEDAHADPSERVQVQRLDDRFVRVTGRCGFMERPNVPDLLRLAREREGLDVDPDRCTYFLSSETIVPGADRRLARWRKALFGVLARNAQRASLYFGLPPNRVVELGMQVEF